MSVHRLHADLQIHRSRAREMSFDVVNPLSLADALDALAADNTLVPLAGATDLMVYLEAGRLPSSNFLNLQELPELKPVRQEGNYVRLGAMTTYRDVRIGNVAKQFPLLALAAREVGALAIQSRAHGPAISRMLRPPQTACRH